MGHTCSGKAIIGWQFSIDDFKYTHKERAFAHDFPEDWQCDPKTGQKLWREETLYGKGFGDCDDPWIEYWEGFPAFVQLDDDRNGDVFIGVVIAHARDYRGTDAAAINLSTLGPRLEELKAKLSQFDLQVDSPPQLWIALGGY